MMPRSTSVVPPWMVSFGATFIAKGSYVVQDFVVARIRLDEGGEIAHPVRQCLLPDGADVLDDGGFHHRLLAGVQHAGDRYRHPPHGVQLRHQPADALGAAGIGLRAERADQFGQHVIGFEESLRARALIGEFGCRLLPGAVDLAEHVIVGHEGIGEHHLVELGLCR